MRKLQCLLIGLLILTQFACGQKDGKTYDLVIRSANIINTYTGKVAENQSIAIMGDSIAAIAGYEAAKGWKAGREVDAEGKFVIPGLWDMHVHFGGGDSLITDNKNLLPLYIANGVTGKPL